MWKIPVEIILHSMNLINNPGRLHRLQPAETAKNKILNAVGWCNVVNRDATDFPEEIFQPICHLLFGILLHFHTAATVGTLFREGANHQIAARRDV